MFRLSKSLFFAWLLVFSYDSLFGYVVVPRSNADSTSRMNSGGDPAEREGLRDEQRSPEYLDDWWGVNDYYYSKQGIQETGKIRAPYDSNNPPYYPLPNTQYYNPSTDPYQYQYNSTRAYRPAFPVQGSG